MVVRNLDVVGIPVDEPETDAPLVVDGDGMLSLPVSLKFVESVAGRNLQVLEARSQVYVLELSRRPLGDLPWKPFRLTRRVQLLRVPVRERLDHRSNVICHVTLVNQSSDCNAEVGCLAGYFVFLSLRVTRAAGGGAESR